MKKNAWSADFFLKNGKKDAYEHKKALTLLFSFGSINADRVVLTWRNHPSVVVSDLFSFVILFSFLYTEGETL